MALILDSHLVMRVGKFHSRFGLYNMEAARAAAETLAELTSVAKALNTFKLHSNASGGSFRRSMIIRPPASQQPPPHPAAANTTACAGGDEHKQVTACRRRVSAYCERAICVPNHLSHGFDRILSLLMHFNLRAHVGARRRPLSSPPAPFSAYWCFVCYALNRIAPWQQPPPWVKTTCRWLIAISQLWALCWFYAQKLSEHHLKIIFLQSRI